MSVSFDTNILVYSLAANPKGDRARSVLSGGGVISVQALNEFASVGRRKLAMDWREVHRQLGRFRAVLVVEPLTIEVHQRGLILAERYQLRLYDALIVAAASLAGCDTLWSEDMHDGLVIDGALTIRDPFA